MNHRIRPRSSRRDEPRPHASGRRNADTAAREKLRGADATQNRLGGPICQPLRTFAHTRPPGRERMRMGGRGRRRFSIFRDNVEPRNRRRPACIHRCAGGTQKVRIRDKENSTRRHERERKKTVKERERARNRERGKEGRDRGKEKERGRGTVQENKKCAQYR